jgi:diguanylate cyclase (GGDEF)-like protein/PAS domain S-box-containing protein
MKIPAPEPLFPLHAAMSPALLVKAEPNVAATAERATILIVDDEIRDRKVLELLLAPEGYMTASVADGEEALAFVARSPPDLILIDFTMPGMDGCQVITSLKLNPATSNIPIIMVTGRQHRSARLAGLAAGAEEFLTKPVDKTELRLRVRNLLRLKTHSDDLESHSEILEAKVRARTADLQRFRTALDTTGDAIFLVSRLTMRYVDANTSACHMLGYTRDELLSLGPAQTSTTPLEQLERVYDAVIASHPTSEMREVVLQRKDGTQLLVEARRQAYRSGADWFIVGVLRDITERKKAEDALKLSEFSVNNASASTYWIASDARILRVNRAACEMLGYTESELLNLAITDLDPEFPLERWLAHWQELRERKRMSFETTHRRKDGRIIPVEVDLNWFEFEGREYDFAFVRDITDRTQAAARIKHLNRVYAMLSGVTSLIVRVRDRDELYREACRIAVEIGGFRMSFIGILDEVTSMIVPVAYEGKHDQLMGIIKAALSSSQAAPTTMMAEAVRGKRPIVSNDSQNDSRVLFSAEYAESGVRSLAVLPLVASERSVGVLALYADQIDFFHAEEVKLLTDLADDIAFAIDTIGKQERLDFLAHYDALTGLANRRLFLDRLAVHLRSAASGEHKLGVALIDLERFKNINDSLGRASGDSLLKQVADWLTHSAAGVADLLARVGPDQFAVVLPRIKPGGNPQKLFETRMHAFLEHEFELDDAVFRVSFKGGVVIFPDDGADAETLFKHAEAALKKAKASGNRYLFYTPDMTNAVAGKLTMENQLRQALDNEEFVLHYQPKVSLASGKVAGVEALIRWNNPREGLVPPAQFIPVLEETGLIHGVGRWALRQAIKDYLRWRAAGLKAVRVAVNVSPLQLRHRDFVGEVRHAIGSDEHAADGLELELTESLIMEDVKHSISSLRTIRSLGVKVAIDDFGTGFSSLSYLAKLPVDTLKIDHSFVVDMTASAEGLSLVSTIINLSHSLKLNVVAEGVETEEQSRLLRLLNCDEIQGFVFSKAIPSELLETRYLALPSTGGQR